MSEQAINIKFVREVEKHPCLYNYELGEYSRKNVTEAAWNEVGKVMDMTGAACKEKWKNLRAVFVRNIKPPPSGSGMKKKKYYLMDFMQFTLPYVKTFNRASRNLTDNSDAQESEIVPESVIVNDFSHDETEDITQESLAEIPSLQTKNNQPSNIPGRKRKKQPLNEIDKSFVNLFKDRQQARENDKTPRKLFLLSLLDEVDKMTDEQMRFFKRRVLNLIDDIMCRPNALYESQQYDLQPSPANSYSTAGTSTSNLTPIDDGSKFLQGKATTEQQFNTGQCASSREPHFGSQIQFN